FLRQAGVVVLVAELVRLAGVHAGRPVEGVAGGVAVLVRVGALRFRSGRRGDVPLGGDRRGRGQLGVGQPVPGPCGRARRRGGRPGAAGAVGGGGGARRGEQQGGEGDEASHQDLRGRCP